MVKIGGSQDFTQVGKSSAENASLFIDSSDGKPKFKNSSGITRSIYDVLPIGSVLGWAKTLTGVPSLPSGWHECDGTVLSDGDSPFDGATLPSLNSTNRFLYGDSVSDTTGGSTTHNHSTSTQEGADPGTSVITAISAASNIPPYYDVVWIIKIKDI